MLDDEANQTHTEWQFTSQSVTTDNTPPGFWCLETFFEDSTAPCQAEPLIYLHYDVDVDIRNTAPAPGAHQLRITVSRHATQTPPVEDLRLWFSTNDGDTWRPVRNLRPSGAHSFTANLVMPPVDQTSGEVSMRVHAWDADGNQVEQTVIGACGLRPRAPIQPGPVTFQ